MDNMIETDLLLRWLHQIEDMSLHKNTANNKIMSDKDTLDEIHVLVKDIISYINLNSR